MVRYQLTLGCAVVALAFGLVLVRTHQGVAQPGIREGAFVVAQDGSRWVVGGGARYRIDWTFDDTNAIFTLPEGRTVATVCEAAALLAGLDPATCTATAAPLAPAPTEPMATPPPTPCPPSGALAPPGTVLFDMTFEVQGRVTGIRSDPFTICAERVELCWELISPRISPRSYANIYLWRERPGEDRFLAGSALAATDNGCSVRERLQPGPYHVDVGGNYERIRVVVRVL